MRRAVAIDDVHFRLLVYTAQGEEVDSIRTRVILDREAPREVVRWLRRFRLSRAFPRRCGLATSDEGCVWRTTTVPANVKVGSTLG